MPRRTWLLSVVVCLAPLAVAHAQLPNVRITSVFPSGAQRGTTIDFTIVVGVDLDGVDRLHFTHPGITAIQKTKPVEGQPAPQPVPNEFQVTVAADVAPGLYEVRAIGTYGISNPRFFQVGQFAETLEVEPNDAAAQATPAAVEQVVNGRFGAARDVDYVKFTGRAGQQIVLEVFGERIDSQADPAIELFDAAGTQLATGRDRAGLDPVIACKLPVDGEYVVRLRDFQYAGGSENNWRLAITASPHVEAVFPPVATAGTVAAVQLLGHNLPGGQPAGSNALRDALELLGISLDVAPAAEGFAWQTLAPINRAALDFYSQSLSLDSTQANVTASVSPWPVVVEQEPNSGADQPQSVSAPCEIAGQFDPAGDVDYFVFEAAKDQVVWIETFAERLGSPADPYVVLQSVTTNDKGDTVVKDLQEIDDTPPQPEALTAGAASRDAAFRFVAPEAGQYRLLVRDLYGASRGEPRLMYRVAIRPETPDFRLVAMPLGPGFSLASTLVRRGGTSGVLVAALRRDGFNDAVRVTAEGLPEGVTCPETVIGTGQPFNWLVFSAAEDAAPFAGPVRIVGRAQIAGQEVVREGRPAMITTLRGQPAARMTRENALAVGPVAPLRIATTATATTLVQSQRLELPIEATRREGFAGPVTVTVLPPKLTDAQLALGENQTSGVLPVFFGAEYPPGTYAILASAAAKVPSPRKDDKGNVIAVDVNELSTPVVVTIAPGPLVLAPDVKDNGAVKQGAALDVPVKLTRRNGFAGPVTLDLLPPPGGAPWLAAAEVAVAADAETGTLHLTVADDAPEGALNHLAVRARLEHAGQKLEIHQPIPLTVQKK